MQRLSSEEITELIRNGGDDGACVRVYSDALNGEDLPMAEGVLIGYQSSPTIIIRDTRGPAAHWSIGLPIEVLEGEEAAEVRRRVARQQRAIARGPLTAARMPPRWVLDAVIAMQRHADEHPVYFQQSVRDNFVRAESCGCAALGLVPQEVQDAARMIAQYLAQEPTETS